MLKISNLYELRDHLSAIGVEFMVDERTDMEEELCLELNVKVLLPEGKRVVSETEITLKEIEDWS